MICGGRTSYYFSELFTIETMIFITWSHPLLCSILFNSPTIRSRSWVMAVVISLKIKSRAATRYFVIGSELKSCPTRPNFSSNRLVTSSRWGGDFLRELWQIHPSFVQNSYSPWCTLHTFGQFPLHLSIPLWVLLDFICECYFFVVFVRSFLLQIK